jgi:hypothetical protein
MARTLLALLLFFHFSLTAKIRLFTFSYNRPELIELQYKTFKKFMLDDYELIVFNDANVEEKEAAIREMCERYGLRCVRYEQEWHEKEPLNQEIKNWLDHPENIHSDNPGLSITATSLETIASHSSVRHCHVIQYALDHFGYQHDDIVALVDADLMPIRAISLREYLKDAPLIGISKYWWYDKVEYLWVPFIAFDPRRLPDLHDLRFHVDIINHKLFDSGAHTYHYLQRHPEVNVKKYTLSNDKDFYHLSIHELLALGYTQEEATLIKFLPWPYTAEFHVDNHFLHFGASSFGNNAFEVKLHRISQFLDKILGSDVDCSL